MSKKFFNSGQHWVWLNAGAISISIIMVVGLLLLIAVRGLEHFWPAEVKTFEVMQDEQKTQVMGEIHNTEDDIQDGVERQQYLIKMGNRDVYGLDFKWLDVKNITETSTHEDVIVVERREWGNLYGFLNSVKKDGTLYKEDPQVLQDIIERALNIHEQIRDIEKGDIGSINYEIEQLRLEQRRLELENEFNDEAKAEIEQRKDQLQQQFLKHQEDLQVLYAEIKRDTAEFSLIGGEKITLTAGNIVRAFQPNQMGFWSKLGHYFSKIGEFIFDEPREANTEGGVFPAIFGTVMMVLLMSVIVTPLGVVAAVYMREYAKQGPLTRTIRIAVNNLAGVPSIVYGVFGLGFFVYFLGGSIDELFYPEVGPSPMFGTPGLIWASLTLALLTLPVVIVSTEEGLARIPKSIREGSLALGATKFETLRKTVLPMASPAMMTGLILAVARAAGEVAPLMLVGVVKLAPTLPLDGNAPFLHLERKFMHLGFHIYDVGFQSPNVEAARPLVYATALLLVLIIIILNIAAIKIRNNLREKYKSLEQ
ncbi:phosphate ABC transporter permease PstA [Kangiella sp. HD9-110m-PIT-SAG07]|nr:phosphate ABC transporter permease PstA [Kangiella sp. HD9-110m-PIT-SAG07]